MVVWFISLLLCNIYHGSFTISFRKKKCMYSIRAKSNYWHVYDIKSVVYKYIRIRFISLPLTIQGSDIVLMLLMNFGMFFQEYSISWKNFVSPSKSTKSRRLTCMHMRVKLLHTIWLIFTTFVVMFFYSNLKASFVIKLYEKEITTLEEIIERYYTLWTWSNQWKIFRMFG